MLTIAHVFRVYIPLEMELRLIREVANIVQEFSEHRSNKSVPKPITNNDFRDGVTPTSGPEACHLAKGA